MSCGLTLATTANAAPPADLKLQPKQALKYNTTYPASIDPNKISYSHEGTFVSSLFETLTRQYYAGNYINAAAESYEVSEDGLTWTFKVRKDAKWSDGVPVRAQDYEYGWKRLTDPVTASPYADYLAIMNVKNANEVFKGEKPVEELGVKALDDHTLQISLSQPTPWLFQMVSHYVLSPLRQDVVERYGDQWTRPENIVTNGAYNLVENKFNDVIVLKKSQTYWNAKDTTIEDLRFSFIESPTASYFGFLNKEYSVSGIPPQFKQKALEELKENLVSSKDQTVYWLMFNVERVPDAKVRKAIALLIDRRTYADKVLKNNMATTMVVPDNIDEGQYVKQMEWFDKPMAERRAEAVKLLKEAGYSKDKPFVFKYLSLAGNLDRLTVPMQGWTEKGSEGLIKFEAEFTESKAKQQAIQAKNFEAATLGWGADYNQVSTFLNTFTCDSPINRTMYCDKGYDQLLQDALVEKDADKRAKIYAEAAQRIQDAYVWLPLIQRSTVYLKDKHLFGYNPDNNFLYFQDYYLVDESSIPAAKAYQAKVLAEAKEAK